MVHTLVFSRGWKWCDTEGARIEAGSGKVLLGVLIA